MKTFPILFFFLILKLEQYFEKNVGLRWRRKKNQITQLFDRRSEGENKHK